MGRTPIDGAVAERARRSLGLMTIERLHTMGVTRQQRRTERAAALGLAGWRIVRFTYEDVVERPDYVVATIGAYLAAAA